VAQSPNDDSLNDLCKENADCYNFWQNRQALSTLLAVGDPWVAVKGKKKLARSRIIDSVEIYLRDKHLMSTASGWRYLSCVSKSLMGEAGNKTTIFSSENIIETFYALKGDSTGNAIPLQIQQVCQSLEEYYRRLNQKNEADRDNREILQKKEKSSKPVAPTVWHEVLAEFAKQRVPNENPESQVAEWQTKYCLFAETCPTSQNSPFTQQSPSP